MIGLIVFTCQACQAGNFVMNQMLTQFMIKNLKTAIHLTELRKQMQPVTDEEYHGKK